MGIDDCPHADDLSDCICVCPFNPNHVGRDCTCTFQLTPKGTQHLARLQGHGRPPRPQVVA